MGYTTDQLIERAWAMNDASPTDGRLDMVSSRVYADELYKEICRECKVSATSGTISTISGTREYNFPSGCAVIEEIQYGSIPLKMTAFKEKSLGEGAPVRYYLRADKIGIDPEPNGAYTLNYYGFAVPTTTLGASDEPTFIPDEWQHVICYGLVRQWTMIDKGMEDGEFMKWDSLYKAKKREFANYLCGGNSADYQPGVI